MELFEEATQQRYRYTSSRGELSTEDLWQLPLQAKDQFDLDTIAKTLNTALKGVTEESFVTAVDSPAKTLLTNKLEVVKHIIAYKLHVLDAKKAQAARKTERDRLIGILAEKQDEALKSLTPEEIKKRLAELDE